MLVRIGGLKKLRRSRTDIMEIGRRLYKYKSVEKNGPDYRYSGKTKNIHA